MRADQLNDHDSLSNQLIQSVSLFESHQGKFPFTHKDIETALPQDSNWTDRGIFQNAGIRTKDGRYFIKEGKDGSTDDKYGYHLGTYGEARSDDYKEIIITDFKR